MPRYILLSASFLILLLPWTASDARDSQIILSKYKPAEINISNIARFNRVTSRTNVWMNTTNWGILGNWGINYGEAMANPEFPGAWAPQCEFPGGSGIQYLFMGAPWIGALVDTSGFEFPRVSVGEEGWTGSGNNEYELEPGEVGGLPLEEHGILERSSIPGAVNYQGQPIYSPDAVAHQEFISVYCDTLTELFWTGTDIIDGPHFPLGIRVTQKVMVWDALGFDDFVVMQYAVKNIGSYNLKNLYLGFFVDSDVGWIGEGVYHEDDVAGFLTDYAGETWNVPYIADNDGRPIGENSGNDFSCPGVSGMLMLSSFGPVYTSSNWWISNGNPNLDYGPRWQDDGAPNHWTDTLGTPDGDARKYFLMSNKEFDYDQWFTADHDYLEAHPQVFTDPFTGQTSTHPWSLESLTYAYDLANGYDARYMVSWGPLGENIAGPGEVPEAYLYPGDSVSVAFAYVCGDNFHDPDHPQGDVSGNNPLDPSLYDYTDFVYNCSKARFLAENNFELLLPYSPQDFRITATPGDSCIALAWDAYSTMPDVRVNLYRHGEGEAYGTTPLNPQPLAGTTFTDQNVIEGEQYFYRGQAELADTIYSRYSNEASMVLGAPFPVTGLEAWSGNHIAYLAWDPNAETDLNHYAIYRADSVGAMQPFDTVPAGTESYEDPTTANGIEYLYAVRAVDEDGYESFFSDTVSALPMGFYEELLVVLERPASGFLEWPGDSLDAFYEQLFSDIGEAPDFITIIPTTTAFPSLPELSPYKILWIIHDAHANDNFYYVLNRNETLEDYIDNGGKVVVSGRKMLYGAFGPVADTYEWLPIGGAEISGELLHNYFKIDEFYATTLPDPAHTPEFVGAAPTSAGFPALQVDTSKVRQLQNFLPMWQPNAPEVDGLSPTEEGEIIYTFQSAMDSSALQDSAVAVRYLTPYMANVIMTFPLYCMEPYESVMQLAAQLLEDIRVGIEEENAAGPVIPKSFALNQNYPNPFNPLTTFSFQLPVASRVKLQVFDIAGRFVATLSDGFQPAGVHQATWDASRLASGIYLCRLQAGDFSAVKKVVLMK